VWFLVPLGKWADARLTGGFEGDFGEGHLKGISGDWKGIRWGFGQLERVVNLNGILRGFGG
jgi:hypothetical protein